MAVAVIDAFFPLVPSETTVIAAGVLAGAGDLSIALVIASAAAGAFLGDNLTYGVGRVFGDRLIAWTSRSEKRKRRFDWAERTLDERGGYLIVVARFIPGGRTVTMLVVGLLEMPWHRFARFDAVAAVFWASYAGLLGYVGGEVFEERPWLGLIVAFGIAFAITTGVEIYRHVRRRLQLEG
jgi:membrane protein DedA with SNARE-associated domain